jgi:hypothetical protein
MQPWTVHMDACTRVHVPYTVHQSIRCMTLSIRPPLACSCPGSDGQSDDGCTRPVVDVTMRACQSTGVTAPEPTGPVRWMVDRAGLLRARAALHTHTCMRTVPTVVSACFRTHGRRVTLGGARRGASLWLSSHCNRDVKIARGRLEH